MDQNKNAVVPSADYVDLSGVDLILNKRYLENLTQCPIDRMPVLASDIAYADELNASVRFFDITRIIVSKNENSRDKLVSVFGAVGATGCSLLLVLQGKRDRVSLYLGVRAPDSQLSLLQDGESALKSGLRGNFPGTEFSRLDKESLKNTFAPIINRHDTISSVTTVAGLRFDEQSETDNRHFVQGLEKLVDAMNGEYTLLVIADPVDSQNLSQSRLALENLYSQLMMYSEASYSFAENEALALNRAVSEGVTRSVSESLGSSVTHTVGKTHTVTRGTSKSLNFSLAPLGAIIGGGVGFLAGGPAGVAVGASIGGGLMSGMGGSSTESESVSDSESQSESLSESRQETLSVSEQQTVTQGATQTQGQTRTIQIKAENHTVKQIQKKIDETLKRYDECADVGMWNCAAYCFSGNSATSQLLANTYHSLMRGKNSSLESGAITVWDREKSAEIKKSLLRFKHPLLNLGEMSVTPGTLVSGSELSIHMGLPNRSVPGVTVIPCAEFGRSVAGYDFKKTDEFGIHSDKTSALALKKVPKLNLGKVFHMHHCEELPVDLSAASMTSHTFVTGSTGSGKSTTVYRILDEINRSTNAKFLIIEPAKGEYKHVFGTRQGVTVYATNPEIAPLLRINPFSFPHGDENPNRNIHILEHLDRLIEIFNVCWPMYAAMPAVLKEAVEKSYEDCGWNLTDSVNRHGKDYYPCFADIVRNIRSIIDSSEYDNENKGAYKGSLITRLNSLSNGINGLVFTDNEISNRELFDSNVVIDLSRVGSAETKSLIMGLLILKLQEYRMTSGKINAGLNHVTVLEEAHNLLKRTSTEQSLDSGNLAGKSVEMLTNAIAEMRTYGEGFIIADQSPGLLDMAAIRNTNTKIIMRLPDQGDRELVGKAAGLNEDQITELSKLPCGVAAVYQNEWIEPVLCKVEYDRGEPALYQYSRENNDFVHQKDFLQERLKVAKMLCNKERIKNKEDIDFLNSVYSMKASSKAGILELLENPTGDILKIAPSISILLPRLKDKLKMVVDEGINNPVLWTNTLDELIRKMDPEISIDILRKLRHSIIIQLFRIEMNDREKYINWEQKGVK